MQMDLLKKKSKMAGLQALIAQMHKHMMGGDGDKNIPVHKALADSEKELNLSGNESPEEEAAESPEMEASEANSGEDIHDHVKAYMKKKGSVPFKGKTVMVKADIAVKKPMMGKKKYG